MRSDGKSPYVSPYIARTQVEELLRWIDRSHKFAFTKNRDVLKAIERLRTALEPKETP